jgi:hypothetical protein
MVTSASLWKDPFEQLKRHWLYAEFVMPPKKLSLMPPLDLYKKNFFFFF